MLGGYYLGQLYLGISGLPDGGTLSVQDSNHQLSSDNINITQKHIFNMINEGIYIRDYGDDGAVGNEYEKSTGTIQRKNADFGQITPVPESNHGFFIVEMGTSGSYTQNGKTNGILTSGNSSSGSYSTDEEDTGNYIKIK